MFVVRHVHKTVVSITNVTTGLLLVKLVKSIAFVCENCSEFIGTIGTVVINCTSDRMKVGTTGKNMKAPNIFLYLTEVNKSH